MKKDAYRLKVRVEEVEGLGPVMYRCGIVETGHPKVTCFYAPQMNDDEEPTASSVAVDLANREFDREQPGLHRRWINIQKEERPQ